MTNEFTSLLSFATFIAGTVVKEEIIRKHALEEAAKLVQKRAKTAIGTYDLGWPQLAQSTMRERQRLGYATDEPLLRTGLIRDSIKYDVQMGPRSYHVDSYTDAYVGSDEDVAVWQELGTGRIPPRSFLRLAAVDKEKEIVELLSEGAIKGILT